MIFAVQLTITCWLSSIAERVTWKLNWFGLERKKNLALQREHGNGLMVIILYIHCIHVLPTALITLFLPLRIVFENRMKSKSVKMLLFIFLKQRKRFKSAVMGEWFLLYFNFVKSLRYVTQKIFIFITKNIAIELIFYGVIKKRKWKINDEKILKSFHSNC